VTQDTPLKSGPHKHTSLCLCVKLTMTFISVDKCVAGAEDLWVGGWVGGYTCVPAFQVKHS